MKSKTLIQAALASAALATLAALPALGTSGVPGARGVQKGDKPEYTWRTELVNGMGKQSLADMRGAPVLVEFWGTR